MLLLPRILLAHGFVFLLLLLISCQEEQGKGPHRPGDPLLSKGRTISLGEPKAIQGRRIDPQTIYSAPSVPMKEPALVREVQLNEFTSPVSRITALAAPLGEGAQRTLVTMEPLKHRFKAREVVAKQPAPHLASPTLRREKAQMNLRYLDVYQGMNAPAVHSLLEDRRGNIWIGTVGGGVSRYDGHSFQHFTTAHGLSHDVVKCLLEDSRGNLWFGTLGGGITRYDGHAFVHFSLNGEPGSDRILALLEDRRGDIWIGTDGGLYRYRRASASTLSDEGEAELQHVRIEGGPVTKSVLCLTEDRQGALWMGTWEGAIRYDPTAVDKGMQGTFFASDAGLNGKSVLSIHEDRHGNIWFGTNEHGLTVYDPSRQELFYLDQEENLSDPQINHILEDAQGAIWLATDGGGVNCLQLHQEASSGERTVRIQHLTTSNGLSHDNVLRGLMDGHGNIWFGTWGGGITLYQHQPAGLRSFSEANGLPTRDLRSILADGGRGLWLGTWGAGLIHYQFAQPRADAGTLVQYTTRQGLGLDNVLSMTQDRHENLWIGTAGAGVTHFDRKRNTFTTYTGEEGLSGYGVNTVMEDRNGIIWLGTEDGGITRMELDHPCGAARFVHFTEEEGLPSNSISDILEDRDGNLWFATKKGAVCFSPEHGGLEGRIQTISTKNGLSNDLVVSLLQDSYGQLWLGTWGGGLHKYEPETGNLSRFDTDNGLNNNWVMALAEDENRNIWVNTLKGFSVLVPEVLEPSVQVPDETRPMAEASASPQAPASYDVLVIGEKEGIMRTGFWWNNLCLEPSGRIWWGTANGLASLNARELFASQSPPVLSLQTVGINDQFLDFHRLSDKTYLGSLAMDGSQIKKSGGPPFFNYPESLSLPHDFNKLKFTYWAIDWTAPEKVQFVFELQGPGRSQRIQHDEPVVEFANLPYGRYTLTATAKGAAKAWSKPLAYTFRIRPPWWHSWWARSLYVLLAAGLGYGLYRTQLSRKLAAQERRRLRELNQFKTRFFGNITHEFRTPVTVIMGMARQIRGHAHHKQLIERNGQRLLQLVQQLLDLSKLEAGQLPVNWVQQDLVAFLRYLTQSFASLAETRDVSLAFSSSQQELMVDQDPELMQQIMSNLLSNALKFTPAGGQVEIALRCLPEGSPSLQGADGQPANGQPADGQPADGQPGEEGQLEILVRDTGTGIPSEDLPHIFDRFYQGKETDHSGGTGVGLAFVKELVEKLGGEILVSSELGAGSTFALRLPIRREAPRSDDLLLEKQATVEEMAAMVPEKKSEQDETLARVLLIEDNPDVSTYIEHCLAPFYHIIKAFDGEAGIQEALQQVPDLIITDVMMPRKSGYEVCEALKTNRITSHIPVLMLTAKALEADKIQGLRQGADVYLTKPFSEEELKIRLHNLLELQKSWQARFKQIAAKASSEAEGPEDAFVLEAREQVRAHLDQSDYGVEEFANDMALSRSQLHRKLKALTDRSATQFINDVRLTEADRLLRKGNTGVAEVAYACGFEYPNYFSRLYKKKFGHAPSEVLDP